MFKVFQDKKVDDLYATIRRIESSEYKFKSDFKENCKNYRPQADSIILSQSDEIILDEPNHFMLNVMNNAGAGLLEIMRMRQERAQIEAAGR